MKMKIQITTISYTPYTLERREEVSKVIEINQESMEDILKIEMALNSLSSMNIRFHIQEVH